MRLFKQIEEENDDGIIFADNNDDVLPNTPVELLTMQAVRDLDPLNDTVLQPIAPVIVAPINQISEQDHELRDLINDFSNLSFQTPLVILTDQVVEAQAENVDSEQWQNLYDLSKGGI